MTSIALAGVLLLLASPHPKEIPFERPVFPLAPLDARGPYLIASGGSFENHGRDLSADAGASSGRAIRMVAGWRHGRLAAEATVIHAEVRTDRAGTHVREDDIAIGARVTPFRLAGGRIEAMLLASASPYATARQGSDWYQGWGGAAGAGLRFSGERRVFLDVDASWRVARFTRSERTELGQTKRTEFAQPRNGDALVVLVGAGLQF